MTVVFGATSGPVPAVVAGTVTGLLFGIFWLVLPLILRARADTRH